jgi:hypothetical protein
MDEVIFWFLRVFSRQVLPIVCSASKDNRIAWAADLRRHGVTGLCEVTMINVLISGRSLERSIDLTACAFFTHMDTNYTAEVAKTVGKH